MARIPEIKHTKSKRVRVYPVPATSMGYRAQLSLLDLTITIPKCRILLMIKYFSLTRVIAYHQLSLWTRNKFFFPVSVLHDCTGLANISWSRRSLTRYIFKYLVCEFTQSLSWAAATSVTTKLLFGSCWNIFYHTAKLEIIMTALEFTA